MRKVRLEALSWQSRSYSRGGQDLNFFAQGFLSCIMCESCGKALMVTEGA